MVLAADSLCIGGFFPGCYGFFPVIHYWSVTHQSSICRAVDMLYVLVIQLLRMNGFFPSNMDFFCVPFCVYLQ